MTRTEDSRSTSAIDKPRKANFVTDPKAVDSPYAWYVLVILLAVYALAWMDRTILSILAEDVKEHYQLTDAQLGFLHGTAFAVFYALFGYPLGRLADRINRVRMLSICLIFWSLMTAFCGLAANFGQLVLSRIGVGIGEAAVAPISYSSIADWFSRPKRATALGLYASGLYLGQGLAFAAGGLVVAYWVSSFGEFGPFGLREWQAAFILLALPGLALAALVASLREPKRGLSDGIQPREEQGIGTRFFGDLASVIPPFSFYQAARCGTTYFTCNITVALLIVLISWALIFATGDVMQWLAFGVISYAVFSAAQMLLNSDPAVFELTWKTPAFVYATIGFGLASMLTINMGFWTAPLALRSLPLDKGTVGLVLGLTSAVCGILGVIVGGRISDMMLRRYPAGRIYIGMASAVIPVPFVIGMCLTQEPLLFFLFNAPVVFFGIMWLPAGAATIQDLVMPRMRGTASVIFGLVSYLVGWSLGPYLVGKISAAKGSLAIGVMASLLVALVGCVMLWMCSRRLQSAEDSKIDRARGAGDVI